MAIRTTATDVKDVLGYNYDNKRSPSLTGFIASASAIVDQVVVDAALKGVGISTTVQELIERWLAGYFYCKMDPLFASKSTQGASGSFVTSGSLENEGERYKRAAIELDPSGCLNALLNRKTAGGRLLRPQTSNPYDTDSLDQG